MVTSDARTLEPKPMPGALKVSQIVTVAPESARKLRRGGTRRLLGGGRVCRARIANHPGSVYQCDEGSGVMTEGAGGLAAVSYGVSPWGLLLIVVVVVFGGWKLMQFLWMMFK